MAYLQFNLSCLISDNMNEEELVEDISTWKYLKMLNDLSFPMIINALIQEIQSVTTMMYIGRLGNAKYIGAATLGNMLCNITGYSLGYGMCAALDTLIAQAYGASLFSLIGLHSQRAIIILTLFAIPVAIVWYNTQFVLYYALHIELETSNLAGEWARWILIGLWPSLMFQVLKKLLQGCGIVWPVILASLIAALANALSCYILIYKFNFSYDGVALSVGIAQWIGFLTLALIIFLQMFYCRSMYLSNINPEISFTRLSQNEDSIDDVNIMLNENNENSINNNVINVNSVSIVNNNIMKSSNQIVPLEIDYPIVTADLVYSYNDYLQCKCNNNSNIQSNLTNYCSLYHLIPNFPLNETWPALSYNIFTNWGTFLSLGFPSAVSLFLEWGSFELMASVSGRLGDVELATHGVYMTTCGLIYMIPQSIADATAVIAGNFLGNMEPEKAKSIINLGICYDMCIGLIMASLLLILRPYWGVIFTSNEAVQNEIKDKLPIMFIYISVDSMKCIALNILRSTGRPEITLYGNVFSCLFVMLPIGWYLGITLKYGLWGIWGAMSLGWFVATVIYIYAIYVTDWNQQALLAVERSSIDIKSSNAINIIEDM